ncbi:MAG: Rne/Rng family ribonuclease [Puniceicoccales bacterium]|jgi:ribonuclease G|nr:Rne/Rng family ribonuclease [Puniceicoccales bacterium]
MGRFNEENIVAELKRIPEEPVYNGPSKEFLNNDALTRAKEQSLIQKIIKAFTRSDKVFREIVISSSPAEKRVALLEDGVLQEFEIEYDDVDNSVGAIFRGRIQNLESGLKAAFVDIGTEKNAFLHYWDALPAADSSVEIVRENAKSKSATITANDIPKLYPIGSEIMVQVIKAQIGTKGPRVTTNIALPGRFVVLMPFSGEYGVSKKIESKAERSRLKEILRKVRIPEGMGLIIRTAGEGKKMRYFVRDIHILLKKWEGIMANMKKNSGPAMIYKEPGLIERTVRDFLTDDIDRVMIDDESDYNEMLDLVGAISSRSKKKIHYFDEGISIFERFNIERQLDQTMMKYVPLHSGGEIVIEEVEALTAIDVNTGAHRNKTDKSDESENKNFIYQVNAEAAKEIARQIRLRNLGGLIIVDFVDMKNPRDKKKLYDLMYELIGKDRERTQILPISHFGLMQISRQRHAQSTARDLRDSCPYCSGRGFIRSSRAISLEIQRRLGSILKRLNHEFKNGSSDRLKQLRIFVHPTVVKYLREHYEKFLIDIERSNNVKLIFRADSAFHAENFRIVDMDSDRELK